MLAIEVKGLKKSFKQQEVLKGVDFEVQAGEIFALLGSNGAGKTTTVKILSTLAKADGGEVKIFNQSLGKNSKQIKELMSLTGQYAAVDETLTGFENLQIVASLRKIKNKKQVATDLLEKFNLLEAKNKRVADYSGGMKRRLDIAMSLVGNPKLIFLDEPTTGLDPQSRIALWDMIEALKQEGITILLTTQYLEEAERLANTVVILNEGVVAKKGTVAELAGDGTLEKAFLEVVGA